MKLPRALPKGFYLAETVEVARALLGCVLWHIVDGEPLAARIVETEAYLGANDLASHAKKGHRSARNEAMYLEGGHAYVYFTYGMHFCMNVVTAEEGVAEAVLLRAAMPVRGIERIRTNRPKAKNEFGLMNGPGKLCQALEIGREQNGASLRQPGFFISARDVEVADEDIAVTPRIGVDYAAEAAHWPLRFLLAGNRYVSGAAVSNRRT